MARPPVAGNRRRKSISGINSATPQLAFRAAPLAATGTLATDAHLAAPAIEHGGGVGSFDRDFEHFPGVDFKLRKG